MIQPKEKPFYRIGVIEKAIIEDTLSKNPLDYLEV